MNIIEISCQGLYYSSQEKNNATDPITNKIEDFIEDFFFEKQIQKERAQSIAEKFIKANDDTRQLFLIKLYESPPLFPIFVEALESNFNKHRLLEVRKRGNTGLTSEQLSFEENLPKNLTRYPPL